MRSARGKGKGGRRLKKGLKKELKKEEKQWKKKEKKRAKKEEKRKKEERKKEERKEKRERRKEKKREEKRKEKEKAEEKKDKGKGKKKYSPPPLSSSPSSSSSSSSGSDSDSSSDSDSDSDVRSSSKRKTQKPTALVNLAGHPDFDPTSPDAIHIPQIIRNTFLANVAPPISAFTPDNLIELGKIVRLYARTVHGHSIPDWAHPQLAFTSDDGIDRDHFTVAMPNFMRCIKSMVEVPYRSKTILVPIVDAKAIECMQGAAKIIINHQLAKSLHNWDAMFRCFKDEVVSVFQG
ncbi:hypothetical protein PENSPDRAFT_695173 [Peniophora sp. CONT]|nr:hypothetical protein PENSPDRAFT_695173 [Peniophora sp. CONT]